MRQVILFVNTTLDGYMAGPNGELDWMVADPQMNLEFTLDLRRAADTIVTGRKFYQGFETAFREQAADPNSPAELVEFANWMIETPKVVFSRTLPAGELSESARLAEADIADEIAALKRQPGTGLVLFGGVETVQSFVRHGLVDEFWIKIHPVAIGRGQAVFADLKDKVGLRLTHSKAHESGILTIRSRPA